MHPRSNPSAILFAPLLDPPLEGLGVNARALSLSLPVPGERLTLIGHSRAADATAFFIPELSVHLDAGAQVHTSRPDHVFITHGHADHSFKVTHLVSRQKPPKFYVPAKTAGLLEDYLFASQQLSNVARMSREEYEINHILVPVEPASSFKLSSKSDIDVHVIECDHTCECVGYLFYRVSNPLKPEYRNLSGKELKALRESHVEITEPLRKPILAFLGDTTASILSSQPKWLTDMPVVVTECTFLHEKHRGNAERTKHTLWSDLEVAIRRHPGTTFILVHFSHQYKDVEIKYFFEQLENPPPNMVIWLHDAMNHPDP